MINVVKCVSGCNGTEWYPFHASNALFFTSLGTLVVRRLRVVCLPRCMVVEGLEIYDSPWSAVGFADNPHSVTRCQVCLPGHRGLGAL